jgi:NADPH:quinone reductase
MRAVGITEFGNPDVLHIVDLPYPQPGPGEVRIRVHAAAVNPTDTGLRSGARAAQLRDIPPPYVPGMDAAGTLDQIGPGTPTDLRIGDHVMAVVVPSGSHGRLLGVARGAG